MTARTDFPRTVAAWTLCLALPLAGCGGGGGGSTPSTTTDDNDDGQTLAEVLSQPLGEKTNCPDLGFSATSGVPGDEITVTGLPEEMGEVGLRVIAEQDDGEAVIDPLFVRLDDNTGEISFATPVHPLDDPEGGPVQLEVGDGELHCPKQAFTINPLPEADPDYTVAVTADLERWTDRVLEKIGYDPQVLLNANPDELPKARLGVWFVKQYVSSDREDSLPNLAARARDNNNELLARLLKASGLEQAIDQAITDMNNTTDGRLKPESRTSGNKLLVRSNDPGIAKSSMTKSLSPSADCEAQAFEPDQLQIGGPADLSERIKAARQGRLFDGSTAGRMLGQASMSDYRNTGNAAGYLGAGVFVVSTVDAARQALEPQRITDFDIESVGRKWVEDRKLSAGDPPLVWGGASVHAEGNEFNLSEATLESLVTALGMVPGPVGTATTAASTYSPDGVNSVIEDLTEDSCVRIRAPQYGPIEGIDDPQWTKVETGPTIELVNAHNGWSQQYKGVAIGSSTLRVALKKPPFALRSPMVKDFAVNVEQVNTSLIPSSVNLTAPGEMVTLAATATNSYNDRHQTDFSVSLPEGKGSLSSPGVVGDRFEVDYNTPENRDDYPTYVQFTANHPTLPSGSGRTYQVPVDIGGELTINERSACLNPGESMPFSAAVDGFADDNQSVSWTSSAGTISSTGDLAASYQAPGSPASVDITATADADGSVTDTVTITVSENCMRKNWWPAASIGMDGDGVYSPTQCVTDNHDEEQVKKLGADNPPSSVQEMLNPDEYWYNRTRNLSGDLVHSSTRYHYDDNNEQCYNVSLSGSTNSAIEYRAEADGTLGASLDSVVTIDCAPFGDSDDSIECSAGGAGLSLSGAFHIDLEEERRFLLEGELSCSALEGKVHIGSSSVGLTGAVSRFEGGEPWLPQPGTGHNIVEKPDGTVLPAQLFNVTCDQPDQVVPISVDFVLPAPPDGETHQVVIFLRGGISTRPNIEAQDDFGPPGAPTLPEPVAGSHTSKADIDFSVKLSPN